VVQIWPGLFVCKQVTVCPGHIWTTLYILNGLLHIATLWYAASYFISRHVAAIQNVHSKPLLYGVTHRDLATFYVPGRMSEPSHYKDLCLLFTPRSTLLKDTSNLHELILSLTYRWSNYWCPSFWWTNLVSMNHATYTAFHWGVDIVSFAVVKIVKWITNSNLKNKFPALFCHVQKGALPYVAPFGCCTCSKH
jgi:hypothetical protein